GFHLFFVIRVRARVTVADLAVMAPAVVAAVRIPARALFLSVVCRPALAAGGLAGHLRDHPGRGRAPALASARRPGAGPGPPTPDRGPVPARRRPVGCLRHASGELELAARPGGFLV